MHPLFGVPDLLEAVSEELDIRSLASMILTCRAFFEPAARVLYRDGGNAFTHVMRHILHAETLHNVDELLARPSSQRFKLYASFVRSLTLTTESIGGHRFAPRGEAIPIVFPSEPLFPHLRELHLEVFTPNDVPLLSVLMCPSLETLELLSQAQESGMPRFLVILVPNTNMLALLEELPHRCPNLHALAIEEPAYFNNDRFRETVVRMLRSLLNLHSFKAEQPDIAYHPSLLEALANLPRLHTLNVVARTSASKWTSPTLKADAFGALRGLTLSSSAAQSTALLEMIGCSDLTELTIRDYETIVDDVPNVFQACARFRKLRLVATQFTSREKHESAESDTVVSCDMFTPMLQCPEINAFVVLWQVAQSVLVLHDSNVLRFAQAWPFLETFVFISHPPPSVPTITFESLTYLATYCPRLTGVAFSVLDASNVPSEPRTVEPNANLSSVLIEEVRGDEEGLRRRILAYWPTASVTMESL